MTKQEFAILASAVRTYYPTANIMPNEQAMELWFRELQDIPFPVAETSLRKWVATNKWPPTIADLRESAVEAVQGESPEWGAGWEKVVKSIGMFGLYRTEEAMESFDEITRQCVQRIGFRNICLSDNINADRANFRMIYEQIAEREKKQSQIPEAVKTMIGQAKEQLAIEGKA